MDRKTALILKGFTELSDRQRSEFIDNVNEYVQGDFAVKRRVASRAERRVIAVDVGPVSQGCPCCGR